MNQPVYMLPQGVRAGDMILDPSRPDDEPAWVEVKNAYRSDYRDGTRAFMVQDAMGNEYEVYASLGRALQVNRDQEVTT